MLSSTKAAAPFSPDSPEDSLFLPRCGHAVGSHSHSGAGKWGDCQMIIKASGRSALMLATGLVACVAAGPSRAAPASADNSAANARSENAAEAPVVLVKHVARHGKTYAHYKSRKEVLKSATSDKAAAPGVDDSDNSSAAASTIPLSVAN